MPVTNGGYFVNGSALVYVTFDGSTYQYLGFTDNGVDMNVQENKSEIITDIFGPMTPQDFQDFGMTARLVTPLIYADRTLLNQVINYGDRTALGELNTPGMVVGVNGYSFGIGIASPFDTPWIFPFCLVRPGYGTRLAVKANVFRLEVYAWPYLPPTVTSGKDAVLFERAVF